jgi:hypothetical protein
VPFSHFSQMRKATHFVVLGHIYNSIMSAPNPDNPAQSATSSQILHRKARIVEGAWKLKSTQPLWCAWVGHSTSRGRMKKSTDHQIWSLITCTPMWCLLMIWWFADFSHAWGWGRLVPYHEPPSKTYTPHLGRTLPHQTFLRYSVETIGCKDRQTDRQTHRQTDGRTDRQTDRMNEWMKFKFV